MTNDKIDASGTAVPASPFCHLSFSIGHFFPPPLQRLYLPAGEIHIQRDDLLHPIVSGNKWRKMTGWLRRDTSLIGQAN